MKVLLINPNRYQSPPVPPIGLEHIAASLEGAGHEALVLDACFSERPLEDIDAAVASYCPDIAGITVRNVDTVLYQTNEFFLDGIKGIVDRLKSIYGLKVIIGGAGVSTNPEGVLDYLNADHAVAGPGEDAVIDLLKELKTSGRAVRVYSRRYKYDVSCPRSRAGVDYRRYYERGGIAGFETHKGCGSSCIYCLEANTRVSFKPVSEVLAEINGFADAGYRRFHLCDSEFNEDIDYCIDFCTALKNSGLDMDWAVYMKPAGFNRKLIRLMKDTGVSLITVSVDSWKKCPLYWSDLEKLIFSARSCGIRIVVDFLTGFPYEEEETLKFYLDLFRRTQPDSVGINTYIRLYKYLPVTRIIMKDSGLKKHVIGDKDDTTFVRPVFYNHLSADRLREMIGGDPLFRIEGPERGVNYGRVSA